MAEEMFTLAAIDFLLPSKVSVIVTWLHFLVARQEKQKNKVLFAVFILSLVSVINTVIYWLY